tara:strand:- start:2850 stop:4619 length:1770 start_codon:yes stop_codon:yes gene_type:complete
MMMLNNISEMPEDIRLIIWDLDETFWDGTLTEGGITYREDHHRLVIDLAGRGIMSAICSKNDHAGVETVLRDRGLWGQFIFPSIDWSPKGPRIGAMLDQIGLRPASVLFIDDNPMNLAQAAQANDELNVALPEIIVSIRAVVGSLGKADPGMTRLAQYKIKERKTQAGAVTGGDPWAFLRASNVEVSFDYDVEPHLDRVIELVNRTNQLNFTKQRVTDAMALRQMLRHNTSDAGLIRVRDRYGDYGFVGFYLTRRVHNQRHLVHFCFSCRTLNMFIEHWVYAFLGRPVLRVQGEVLSDPVDDPVHVDWITARHVHDVDPSAQEDAPFDTIVARGGCDLASVMHYLALYTGHQVEEYNEPRNNQILRRDHSAFLLPAVQGGLTKPLLSAAETLGYGPSDFETAVFDPRAGRTLFLFSFWADADIPLYRHRATGLKVPYWLVGAQNHDLVARADLRGSLPSNAVQAARLRTLCADFDHDGVLTTQEMILRYGAFLDTLPQGAEVVLMLANEKGPRQYGDPTHPGHPDHVRLNQALVQVATGRRNVMVLDPAAHINGRDDLIDLNHFRRDVYHRMAQAIVAYFAAPSLAPTG